MIKPQFEAGREKVGKKGVVRDPATHRQVIEAVCSFALETGFSISGLTFSPVKGPEGNIEYLIYLKKSAPLQRPEAIEIDEVVTLAHRSLEKSGRAILPEGGRCAVHFCGPMIAAHIINDSALKCNHEIGAGGTGGSRGWACPWAGTRKGPGTVRGL